MLCYAMTRASPPGPERFSKRPLVRPCVRVHTLPFQLHASFWPLPRRDISHIIYVLKELRNHAGAKFNNDIGSHGGTEHGAEDLRHGLWAAASLLTVRIVLQQIRGAAFVTC